MPSIACNVEVRIVPAAETRARRERLRIGMHDDSSDEILNDKTVRVGVEMPRRRGGAIKKYAAMVQATKLHTTTPTMAPATCVEPTTAPDDIKRGSPCVTDVLAAIAHCAGFGSIAEMMGTRTAGRVCARLVAVHLVPALCKIKNHSEIARIFNRNHSTIYQARNRSKMLLARGDASIRELIDKTRAHLRSLGFELIECAEGKHGTAEHALQPVALSPMPLAQVNGTQGAMR